MFDREKFRMKLIERGTSVEEVAEQIGINAVTLYRKQSGVSDFRRNDIQNIARVLRLTKDEVMEIFFAPDPSETQVASA